MYKILNKTFPKLPTEDIEQKELVAFLKRCGLFVFAVKNENTQSFANRRNAIVIEQKAKQMGKLAGTPDLCVFGIDNIYFFELKRQKPLLKSGKLGSPTNKASKEQLEFIDRSNKYDYCQSYVCYGCDEVIKILKDRGEI
jgi:hypothetical protein